MNIPKPLVLSPDSQSDLAELEVIKGLANLKLIDVFENQVKELGEAKTPAIKGNGEAKTQFFIDYCHGRDSASLGNWVYYPWNNSLVHVLPKEEFFFVRTVRNQPLISKSDQQKFNDYTVGIIGLSVGNSIALALAYSGGCNNLKLADPDILELSNLNRLPSNILNLGENKTHITAKQIYEVNPYANLLLFDNGINADNLETFFLDDPKIDLVIDECDDITLKFNLRLAARALRIPLAMATDNGFESNIDVIRFDRNQNAGGMHKTPLVTLADIKESLAISESLSLSPEEELHLITQLIGVKNVSHEMQKGCIERIKRNVVSWPQLSMTVFAGASLSAYSVLQAARGHKTKAKKATFSFPAMLKVGHHSKKELSKRKRSTAKFVEIVRSLNRNIS